MILEITKIEGGLRWNNQDRLFTYSMLANGYDITGVDLCYIELDNQLYMMCSNDSTVDGNTFDNIQDEINYIYEI
jgi:hypothetical protein